MNTLVKKSMQNHYLGLGKVFHGRRVPTPHKFTMSVYMLWVNLDAETANFEGEKADLNLGKWSRFAPEDYWHKTAQTAEELQSQIIKEWQSRGLPIDSVCALTNPRALNTKMNPLSVFYCYERGELVALIAEVTNTPWEERHHYFITVGYMPNVEATASAHWQDKQLVCHFDKAFHVSPFNPIDMGYEMRFRQDSEKVSVIMQLTKNEAPVFDAALNLSLTPLTADAWRQSLWQNPWMTMQVRLRIYYEALRLAIKRAPFYTHPDKKKS